MGINQIKFVTCHQMPHRSFFIRGRQLPLCSRCTGIYLGYLTMPIFLFELLEFSLLLTLLLILPTVIDGLTQAFLERESTNVLRFSTGLLAGVGVASLVHIIGNQIGTFFFNLDYGEILSTLW